MWKGGLRVTQAVIVVSLPSCPKRLLWTRKQPQNDTCNLSVTVTSGHRGSELCWHSETGHLCTYYDLWTRIHRDNLAVVWSASVCLLVQPVYLFAICLVMFTLSQLSDSSWVETGSTLASLTHCGSPSDRKLMEGQCLCSPPQMWSLIL